jgi:HEXXH motif-containing protein
LADAGATVGGPYEGDPEVSSRPATSPEFAGDARDIDLHVLPVRHFDALSRGLGDVDTVRLLWSAQRSRRLVMMRALLDAASADPAVLGPLPPSDQVWETLLAAAAAAPADFDTILLHPQLGSWMSYALRRHQGGTRSDQPLWVDFGCLHVLALAAAARAGIACSTRVPLRAGRVTIPELGSAHFTSGHFTSADELTAGPLPFAEAWSTGDGGIGLRHGDQELAIPAGGDTTVDGWWRLRQLAVGPGPVLRVWLDDLDHFRDLADPVAPVRLEESTVDWWRSILEDAWTILCTDHAPAAAALAAGITSLVPLPAGDGWGTRSASTGDAFGAVMMSPPSDPVTLAVALVHEFMHIKLGGLMHLVQLTVDDLPATLYAPWRDDPRPLGGLLQGVYAFFGIAGFWRSHRLLTPTDPAATALAHFEYAYARQQATEGLRTVIGSGRLTGPGQRFTTGVAETLRSWAADDIPSDVDRLARTVADCHRAGWRIRHLRPDPEGIERLARAWASGDAAGPVAPSTVVASRETRWSQARLGLARRRILVTDGYRDIDDHQSWAASLSEADFALMSGDASVARGGFETLLAKDPDRLDAWSGLAAAVAQEGPAEAAEVLRTAPDVVLAVYRRVAATGAPAPPVALAAWIGHVQPP